MKRIYTQLEGKSIRSISQGELANDYELLLVFTDGSSLRVLLEVDNDIMTVHSTVREVSK